MTNQNKFKFAEHQIWNILEWNPSKQQIKQFQQLQSELKKWNTKVNLTKLIEGNDFWLSQICDSLWPVKNQLQSMEGVARALLG